VARFGLAGLLLAIAACGPSGAPRAQSTQAPAASPASTAGTPSSSSAPVAVRRDLSADESSGGHTLARHVGRTDAQLAERLRHERDISAASTWTDRDTAERAVGEALGTAGNTLTTWERRSGRRPNLVLHYVDRSGATLGRSLTRNSHVSVVCTQALVVLKWNERADRFFVLTSYPEADR
jgi:hypothetical protein